MSAYGPDNLTTDAMMARLAPHIERAAGNRAEAKADRRARFPTMAEATDLFRDAGLNPQPRHAINAAGEEWGTDPLRGHEFRDTRCHIAGKGYEARLIEMAKGWKDGPADYRERMHRCVKPI